MGIFSGIGKFLFGLGSSAAQHPTSVIKAGTQVATGNIGGAADTLLSAYESDQARSQQMKDSKAMMKYQNDLNIANWNMQNEYNTPANQLKRLQEAGINPLMVMPDTGSASQPSAVSGQSAPDISSLLQYQLQAQLQHEQVKLLKQQEKSARLDNAVKEKETRNRIAELNSEYDYLEQFTGSAPDDSHDWKTDRSGKWYYLDDNNNKVYASYSNPDATKIRDILRHVEYNKKLDEAETVRFNKLRTEAQAKQDYLTWLINEEFQYSLTARQYDEIVARISEIEARTDLTEQQKIALELDNQVWQSLGIGGKVADGILRLILHVIK